MKQEFRVGGDVPLFEEAAPEVSGVRVLKRDRAARGVRRNRVLRTASARIACAPFEPGCDYEVFTNGEFSLLDAVLVMLEKTGPADVAIGTWSAGLYDLEVANRFVSSGLIRSLRLVLDVSFKNNRGSKGYAADLMQIFGEECIRTTRTHAKFVVISNESHYITISSTANLNDNKRLEVFYFSDDKERADFYLAFVDELFHDVKPGWNPDTGAPSLNRLDPTGSEVDMGRSISVGRVGIDTGNRGQK